MSNLRIRFLSLLLGVALAAPGQAAPRRTPEVLGPSVPREARGKTFRRAAIQVAGVKAPSKRIGAPKVASSRRVAPDLSGAGANSSQPPRVISPASEADPKLAQAGAGLFDGAKVREALKDWFGGFVQSVIPDPAVTETRAKRFMPAIRAAHSSTWRKRLAMLPEEANGVSTERALKLLSRLGGVKDPAAGARHIRNGTYFQALGDRQEAVVKKVFRRSLVGDSKVYHVTNDVRYEVLAFHLDRYLGTNLVPPAVVLSADTVAQLRINAWPIGVGDASRAPPNLMEMSHLQLLDLLVSNPDRTVRDMFAPDNLLADDRGKIIGIDFDLARPKMLSMVASAEHNLPVDGVLLEPHRRFWSRGSVPGVYSKKVLARLKAMDGRTLSELARKSALKLTEAEMQGILSARSTILQAIANFQARYGGLIFLP